MPASKAQRAQTAERRKNAIAMRLAGADWDLIREKLGYASRGAAYTDVQRAFETAQAEMRENVATLRHVTNLRLERLLMVVYPMALRGDLKAFEQARGIIADQRKLNGLDEPTKHEHLHLGAIEAEIAKLEALIPGNDPDPALPGLDHAALPPV